MTGFGGSPRAASPLGGGGGGGVMVELWSPQGVSATATNLAAATFSAVSDPVLRRLVDLRGARYARVYGTITGSPDAIVAANKVRVQYHPGGDLTVSTSDAGWQTLVTTAGSHTSGAFFTSEAVEIPAAARVNPCVVRGGLYDGDGTADPKFTGLWLLITG